MRVAVDDASAQLIVTFFAPIPLSPPSYLVNPLSYSLTGGQRLFPRILKAERVAPVSPPRGDSQSIVLTLDKSGDFSTYTLTVSGPDIDPFFGSAKLRFRLACDDAFDCRTAVEQPVPPVGPAVAIDYLTKDYSGFRQALLDFVPTRLPGWTERSEADLGIMLLELFAATADTLSYEQDRVANEAFLATATQRRSVADHLALIGYQMDDGASASTFLQFQVSASQQLAAGFKVSNDRSRVLSSGFKGGDAPGSNDESIVVFETLADARLDKAHNQMTLYDWGNTDCCLPRHALSAALVGTLDGLRIGDYLLFDGGSGQRDIVRLSSLPKVLAVAPVASPPAVSPPVSPPAVGVVTVLTWSPTTPLSRDYCVKDTVVRGNVVPATHGETVFETLRSLTEQQRAQVNAEIAARPALQRVPRQRLKLGKAPLAHLDAATLALAALPQQPAQDEAGDFTSPIPRGISTLHLQVDGEPWVEKTSLLEGRADDPIFRVEIDDAGEATALFGDGVFGRRLPETAAVTATYRVGGGAIGNVGADTLTLPQPGDPGPWFNSVTNPLPATGGRDLESRDHARRTAPPGFHQPLVAVSSADYQRAATSFLDAGGRAAIQRANADFRWTGSWLTVTLSVDPLGTEGLTPDLRQELLNHLENKRLVAYDLDIQGPIYLPVDLMIQFCTAAGSQQNDVQQSLSRALSNSDLPDGAKGFFHPDNFSFGDNLYVSRIYAAVMAVPGVQSAQITRLAALHSAQPERETTANLARGFLAAGLDQVIRLDNDRNFPQNGTLVLMPGGVRA
jgi:hypothetical protein